MISLKDLDFLEGGDMRDKIVNFANKYKSIKIAVAFLKNDGFEPLKGPLRLTSGKVFVDSNKRIEFLVGLSPYYITDSEPLTHLLNLRNDLKKEHKEDRLQIRYYGDTSFHPKLFLFEKGSSTAAIVGSSNMTGGGTRDNIEANISFELASNQPLAKRVSAFFEDIWRIDSSGGPVILEEVHDKNLENYRSNKSSFDRKRQSDSGKHEYDKGKIRSRGKRGKKSNGGEDSWVGWILNHQMQDSAEEVIEGIKQVFKTSRLWDWKSHPPFRTRDGPYVILLLYDMHILGHACVGIRGTHDIPPSMRKAGSTFAFELKERPFILRDNKIEDIPVRELVAKDEVPTFYSYIELHSRPRVLKEYKSRIGWKENLCVS
jgi:HKD family nuclease